MVSKRRCRRVATFTSLNQFFAVYTRFTFGKYLCLWLRVVLMERLRVSGSKFSLWSQVVIFEPRSGWKFPPRPWGYIVGVDFHQSCGATS